LYCEIAYASNGIKVVSTNKTAITIVALKSVFSMPRRVLKVLLALLSPPKPAPSPEAERCISTAMMSRIERVTWTYGNIPIIVSIADKGIIGIKMCNPSL